MSDFINKADYGTAIRNSVLDDVTQADSSKLDTAEKRAISIAKDHLAVRFDVAAIFSATGDDRNEQVVGVVVDITLYLLHRRLNPRKIPTLRKEAYEEAMTWLMQAKDGEILPDLPKVEGEEAKEVIEWGSNPRRGNHI